MSLMIVDHDERLLDEMGRRVERQLRNNKRSTNILAPLSGYFAQFKSEIIVLSLIGMIG